MQTQYRVGQQVIYNDEIAVVINPPKGRSPNDNWYMWIHRPAVGYESHVSRENVRPLPDEFKRDLSDPAIPYEETHQPTPTNALRDFLAGVLCALAVGIPLTVVYLWRTGGL